MLRITRGSGAAGRRPTAVVATVLAMVLVVLGAGRAQAQQRFADLVGRTSVGPVKSAGPIEVPFITWGGDVATFHANAGLATGAGSIYQKLGLNVKLVKGDDFPGQVRRYLAGDSPFLRGEVRMIGMASEVLGADPRTKPVVVLQLTWSAGDHCVGRAGVRTLSDLKGKKVALQQGGPHVGMLDDILRAAQLTWGDVTVVWAKDLTGPNGPAEMFRRDGSIDACFVISPDMLGLTGGLDASGSGAEGTVKDARVVVSTAQMSRSIADVYAVRKDFYDANKAWVEKFVAGYLKASERVVELRGKYDPAKGTFDPEYRKMLEMAQGILGKDVLPTLEVDAHGLLLDASFVGLPGNKSWFLDKGNLDGFEPKQRAALDLAVGQGYAGQRAGFFGPDLDWDKVATLGDLRVREGAGGARFAAEAVDAFPDKAMDERTILSFTIAFEPNQTAFGADVYGPEFRRALQAASTFGNAVIAVRGHSDPTKTLVDFVKAGMERGVLKRTGTEGSYKYFFQGKPLDLTSTKDVIRLIESGGLDGTSNDPRQTMQAALNLSRARAEAVRDAIVAYAKAQNVRLEASQIQPMGVGVAEPLIAKPSSMDEAKQNMRVEFRLLKVPAEAVQQSDFNF